MNTTFTSDRYELRNGYFLILSTESGDKYEDLSGMEAFLNEDDLRERAIRLQDSGSIIKAGREYFTHKGWIITDALDSRTCFEVLSVFDEAEAKAALAEIASA